MRDPLTKALQDMALTVSERFSSNEQSREMIESLADLIDEAQYSRYGWHIASEHNIVEQDILATVWLNLGVNYPAQHVQTFSAAQPDQVEVSHDLGQAIWGASMKRYPMGLLACLKGILPFTPESMFEGTIGDPTTGQRTPDPVRPFLSALLCTVVYLGFIDAGIGNRQGYEAKCCLIELMVRDNVYVIGTNDDRSNLLVPVSF